MTPDAEGERRDTFPRPDPTKLTTAALDREVARIEKRLDELHKLHTAVVNDLTQLIEKTAAREVLRLEARVDTALANLKEWHEVDILGVRQFLDERLKTIDLRFELIEQRRLELKIDNQINLDKALSSARESVANLADTYETGHTTLSRMVDEVKNRLTIVESKALGSKETSTATLAMVGLGLTAAYLIANIVVALVFHH